MINCFLALNAFCPGGFDLYLENSGTVCDSRMEWMKRGEREGWLTVHGVNCENFPGLEWDEVTLSVSSEGYYEKIFSDLLHCLEF